MKKASFIFLGVLGCCLFFLTPLHAQRPSVSVDHFSGSLGVSYPLYRSTYGSIPIPINLSYAGGGVKVKQVEGNAGLGWNLQVGGEISRQVRGLPDDSKIDNLSNAMVGWLYSGHSANIDYFTIANDNDQSTTGDENTDFYPLYNYFPSNTDTEPDIFYVNAPGLSCKLVLDGSGNARTIPYQDIKVTYTTETGVSPSLTSYGRIKQFSITNAQGVTYNFGSVELTRKQTSSSSPSSIKFFKKEFDRYLNGIDYISSWKLTSISDQGGHVINMVYTEPKELYSKDRMQYTIGNSSTLVSNFTSSITTYQIELDKMSFNHDYELLEGIDLTLYGKAPIGDITIDHYATGATSGKAMVKSISGHGQVISLEYLSTYSSAYPTVSRSMLKALEINGKRSTFDYYGLSSGELDLPDSLSNKIDLWGYYDGSSASSLLPNVYINPSSSGYERYRNVAPGAASSAYPYSIAGEARAINASTIMNGSLKKINYEEGGSTTIVYEPNDYSDPTAGSVISGGGIRVKQLIDHDGMDTLKNIKRNYAYVNPATGVSSGKAISVPLLAFTTPYTSSGTTEQQWQKSVVRMEENFSQENNAVVYTHVRESMAGIGSSLYEYLAPATFWDASAAPDWAPTITYVARPTSTFGGYTGNEINTYPFAPNPNFDFERGLPKKVTRFDESGNKVTESSYTYTRTGSPTLIYALISDYNAAVVSYTKYPILASVGNLSQQVTNTVYDAPSTSQYNQTVTDYSYAGSGHKMPTLVTQTNSDGSIRRSYSKYMKDYNVATHSDDQTTAIYNLQQIGVNFPIETYSQLERGGTNKTIGASLVKLKPWSLSTTQNLPTQQLSLLAATGLSDFSVSTNTGGTFAHDSRYVIRQNITSYSPYGIPVTVDNGKHQVSTTLTTALSGLGHASFANAALPEIGVNDFDNDDADHSFVSNLGWFFNASLYSSNARSGMKSLSIGSSNYFTRTITKTSARKFYMFSIWVNTASTGNITLSLTNASSTTLTYTLPFANTSGTWKYYQMKVPVTAMSDTFVAKYQSDAGILIDDVLFYPADAIVGTVAYNADRNRTSVTDANGVSQYFEYDSYKRPIKVLDQDKNMVLKKSYVTVAEQQAYGVTIGHDKNYEDEPIHFTDANSINGGDIVTYTWNFGDGTAAVTSTNPAGVDHTYASPGTYTVSLSKTSALLGTVSGSTSVTITTSTTPSIIMGSGDLTIRLFQGSSLMYDLSGSAIYSGTNVTPGNYTVQVSTAENPYSSSYPSGFKRWTIDTYNGSTFISQDCRPSSPNVKVKTTTMYLSPGLMYNFSISEYECELLEVQ